MKQAFFAVTMAVSLTGCATHRSDSMPKSAQTPKTFNKKVTTRIKSNYLLFLPADYGRQSGKRWPMILFLHGAGERGTNIWKVAVHGPPKVVNAKKDFPFIVVSPQCPDGEVWSPQVLLGLLDEVISKYRVNTNRIYLTGLSMGGYGTWKLGLLHPERFAAMAPICGGGEPIDVLLAGRRKANALKTLGVWAFHGAKDSVVRLEESERMINALKRAGGTDVELTVYPEAGHDSWTETYNNPKLYEWFLEHERKAAAAPSE